MSGCPIKRYPVVNGDKLFGSEDCEVIGLKLRMASIWAERVDNSSNVNSWVKINLLKWYFADFTVSSHMPPNWGAASGWKCHIDDVWNFMCC